MAASISADLKALSGYLAQQNRARVERLHEPDPAPAVTQWRVVYHFDCDRPGMEYSHKAESPRALVQFMRDTFKGNPFMTIVRLREVIG